MSAQVTAVPPFAGDHSETFEEYPVAKYGNGPITAFGGLASITGESLETDADGMFTICGSSPPYFKPIDGSRFLGSDMGRGMRITFSQPVSAFGGYWGNETDACFAGVQPATFTFRDAAGNQIGTEELVYVGDGTLVWRGWIFDTPVTSVTFEGPAADGLQAVLASNPSGLPKRYSQLLNLSTRKQVGPGDDVLIGGFIVVGSQDKQVIVRGLGPSLLVAGPLQDPTLEIHRADAALLAANNDWRETQEPEIKATGIPPSNDLESAIVINLTAKPATEGGAGYTAILTGSGGGTGIGLLEIFDLATGVDSTLANISTRGFVGTADDLLIGGFIPGPPDRAALKVLVRALGPSLANQGVSGTLQDPLLELHDGNGNVLAINDNWKEASNASDILATLPPRADRESAIMITLAPSNSGYTAVVRGVNDSTGVALVEVYALR